MIFLIPSSVSKVNSLPFEFFSSSSKQLFMKFVNIELGCSKIYFESLAVVTTTNLSSLARTLSILTLLIGLVLMVFPSLYPKH